MRKLLCAMLVLALLAVPVLALSVSAESIVDEDIIISDLIPVSVDGNFEATDCEVKINDDGSMTITVTGAAPVLNIKLAEGTTLYTGSAVNVSEDAFVAVDFGTTGSIQFTHMILHYTRKDKADAGTFADLYLNSMCDANYVQYRKQISNPGYVAGSALSNDSNYYSVWDWGTYVNVDGKAFEDKMHQFVDMVINLTGSTVGSTVTFYTIAVVNDAEVELGTVRPDPVVSDDPSDDPDPSDDTSETSEETSETSDDESSADESSDESTPAESSDTSSATSSATSSTATSGDATSNTSSTGTSSATSAGSSSAAESSEGESGGLGTGAIVGIIAAIVVVIGAVVGVVVFKKKK